MGEVCSPGAVKHAGEVEWAVQRRFAKVKMLERQFNEHIGEKMNIAIITGMMPITIQDHIFQVVSTDTKFDELLEK